MNSGGLDNIDSVKNMKQTTNHRLLTHSYLFQWSMLELTLIFAWCNSSDHLYAIYHTLLHVSLSSRPKRKMPVEVANDSEEVKDTSVKIERSYSDSGTLLVFLFC